jgi:hypothetical protein
LRRFLDIETFTKIEFERLYVSDRFERLWQQSKTNTFDPKALAQHLESATHRPHAQTMRKALEEIAVNILRF